MKGRFIKVTRIIEDCDRTRITERKEEPRFKVDWANPGQDLWIRMQKDMYDVYADIDHHEIMLESTAKYLPDVEGITSWCGFSYLDYNSVEDSERRIENWYLFVE